MKVCRLLSKYFLQLICFITASEDEGTSMIEEDCQVVEEDQVLFSEHVEKNTLASLIDKKTSNHVPVKCLSSQAKDQLNGTQMNQTQQCETESYIGALIKRQSRARNGFYIDENCFDTLNWKALGCRRLLYETISTIYLKTSCPLERHRLQSCINDCFKLPVTSKELSGIGTGKSILPCITQMEYSGKCLGLKRQLDQSVDSEITSKLFSTLVYTINEVFAYWRRSRKECNTSLSNTCSTADTFCGSCDLCCNMASYFNGAYACSQSMSTYIADQLCRSTSAEEFKVSNLSDIRTQTISNRFSQSLMHLDQNRLKFPLLEHRSPKVLKLAEVECSRENTGAFASCDNKQHPEHGKATCASYKVAEKMIQSAYSPSFGNSEAVSSKDGDDTEMLPKDGNDVGSPFRNEHEMLPGDEHSYVKTSRGTAPCCDDKQQPGKIIPSSFSSSVGSLEAGSSSKDGNEAYDVESPNRIGLEIVSMDKIITCSVKTSRETTSISDNADAEKITQSSYSQSVVHSEAGSSKDGNVAYDVGSSFRNEPEMLPLDISTSVKTSRERSKNVMNSQLIQPVICDSADNSEQNQYSEEQTLIIKFPSNYILPSKEELVKKLQFIWHHRFF